MFFSFFSLSFFYPNGVIYNNHFFYGVCFYICILFLDLKHPFFHGETGSKPGETGRTKPTRITSWTGFAYPLLRPEFCQNLRHSLGPPFRPLPNWSLPLPWLMKQTFPAVHEASATAWVRYRSSRDLLRLSSYHNSLIVILYPCSICFFHNISEVCVYMSIIF